MSGDNIETKTLKQKIKVAMIPGVLLLAASMMVLGLNLNFVGAGTTSPSNVVASATVLGLCYVSVPATMTFTSIPAGSSDPTNLQITDTDTGGNQAANVFIAGNALWVTSSPGASNSFAISNTLWNPTTNSLSTVGNAITTTLIDTRIQIPAPTQVAPTQTANIYFGLNVPGGVSGSAGGYTYTTTITIMNGC